MPGDLIPNVWRDEDEGDFWTREPERESVPEDEDLLGWCAPPTGCNRVRWLAFVTKRDSDGRVMEGVCRTCMREAVVKSL